MNAIENEFRIMDTLPRRQAYVSMFVLGAILGVAASMLLYLVFIFLLPFVAIAVAVLILGLVISPLK